MDLPELLMSVNSSDPTSYDETPVSGNEADLFDTQTVSLAGLIGLKINGNKGMYGLRAFS